MKFLKMFSDRYPKDYKEHIAKLPNYLNTIIKAYHPINVAVTAYSLSLFEDYLWKVEDEASVIKALKETRDTKEDSFLQRFADTLGNTDNILMVYYNIKFINELIAAVIQEDPKLEIQN